MNLENKGKEQQKLRADLMKAMEELANLMRAASQTERRVRNAIDRIPPDEPCLAGLPVSKFNRKPYVHVAKGKLCDGDESHVVKANVIRGRHRHLLAYFMTGTHIHELEVFALGASKPADTFRDCTERAQVCAAKYAKAMKGINCKVHRANYDCHSAFWSFHSHDQRLVFSVAWAYDKAKQAKTELEKDNITDALTLAMEAIKLDDVTNLGHEVLGEAVMKRGLDNLDKGVQKQAVESAKALADWATRLGWIIDVVRANIDTIHADVKWHNVPLLCNQWVSERDRLVDITTPILAWDKEHGHDREQRFVNSLIVELRSEGNLGADPYSDDRVRAIFTSTPVRRLYAWLDKKWDKIERQCKGNDNGTKTRKMLLACLLDNNCNPDIIDICKLVRQLINPYTNRAVNAREDMADLSREWNRTAERLFHETGIRPTDEEIIEALHLSRDDYGTLMDWRRMSGTHNADYLGNKSNSDNKLRDEDDDDRCDPSEDEDELD